MKTLLNKWFVMMSACALTSPVFAEIYIGGNLGHTDYQESVKSASFELMSGYNFNEYLGVELFYLDLGDNEVIDPTDLAIVNYNISGWGGGVDRESSPCGSSQLVRQTGDV